jgi:hypothetical protein
MLTHEMREAGLTKTNRPSPARSVRTVGCQLDLHVQDNEIVKVTSRRTIR